MKKSILAIGTAALFAAGFVSAYVIFAMPDDSDQNHATGHSTTNNAMMGMMDAKQDMTHNNTTMMTKMMMMNMPHMTKDKDTILLTGHTFMPDSATVEPSTTISWQNHSPMVHNIVGTYTTQSGNTTTVIASPDVGHMQSWSYTFDESGVFTYHCTYHYEDGMRAEITIA